jgi:thioredoxin reductase (NADPH)
MALTARAYNQAHKFGVETATPNEVIGFEALDDLSTCFILKLASGERVSARSIVIASGVNYRRLALENLDAYEGASVHCWATRIEARLCANQEVVLVGGGNSAGQAVVFLSEHVAKVWTLVRGADLASTMSRYLVDRVSGLANVRCSRARRSPRWKGPTACRQRGSGIAVPPGKRFDTRFATCFSLSVRTPIPAGCLDRAWR